MDRAGLKRRLEKIGLEEGPDGLRALMAELGFTEPKKSATNLHLLGQLLADATLVAAVVAEALDSADPDQCLNGSERLADTLPRDAFLAVMRDPVQRPRFLTLVGASSFLTAILCRKSIYFHDLFVGGEFDRHKDEAAMLDELRQHIADEASFDDLQRGLRQYKAREVLRIGSRDLCGLAGLQEVTAELSALAAATLQRAYEVCDHLLRLETGTPLLDVPEGTCPMEPEFTILGMGKFGGCELNFSSDIDIIYFYSSERGRTTGIDDGRGGRKNSLHLHQYFVKLSEMITRAIGQVTADGFVFRVDLRLRPEGNSGEMANSLRSAEVYYESWGQSWERAAMLKARPVAGSLPLGQRLLQNLEPFIYRRYLDYAMVEDIKTMKQKINQSLSREQEGELNLKLGRGGIREIEFFIQALQLIYAGKNMDLREKNSLRALALLHKEGLIEEADCRVLTGAYIFLRTVEHRIQVVQERQTHSLPVDKREFKSLARRCGFPDEEAFSRCLEEHRRAVEAIYLDLFYTSEEEIREEVRPEITFLFDPAADIDYVKDMLEAKGCKNPDAGYEVLLVLRDGPPHAHLTQKARRQLERIAPLLMQEVLDSPEPDMALLNLERFLSALRARGTFFALLAENREIIRVLISLFGTSQFLSRIFIQHPEILDSLVSRSYAVSFKPPQDMEKDLSLLMQTAPHYEDKLDVLRRFRNEEMLRIALNDIHGKTPQGEGTLQLSQLADICLKKAYRISRNELIPRFGLPFCADAQGAEHEAAFAIVGLGKLGGMELNYHSDLDIIFIYEGEGQTRPVEGTEPDRFRQQSNQEYFARLAQRIISVLTLMTREGYVYQIDTRLRPSGNQGPLVTSLSAYEHYHQSSAQIWERQALTKARVVVGPETLAHRIAELTEHIVYERPLPETLREEICRLRNRMESEIAREGASRLNIKTGRGGLVDVEFIAQYLQLLHGGRSKALRVTNTLKALEVLHRKELLSDDDFDALDSGYKFLRRLENKLRLVHDQSISELSSDRTYLLKLARRLGYPDRPRRPDDVFLEEYHGTTENIREVFSRLLCES
ncbi:bifunctional [glutamate--ammonia ligase]-adenylyl-L-tyrosine phosphorylase/[glutamate--ammonia-ligase] adenylyltransferase [Desulfuromonas sp. AOP6]|uniref:bifunctional [glutamate--ammonia ligase]-adenylyl-L-tyrosine phosphorylase/[glutamate--ammonia-ligase] adenylyltransferase n=1 Tax=Desulfuromonas sp. AOP6 TaxID=1566351 RepID=UPI00126B43FA|nr:bifunctional [glutamate--ammonia ligase]-adenylyl-L-tyrosine phosphorylase/[glutamate--ammonia-ligase] adenylyltransferase [Desulfuromonas sp. AOP6]BCA81018.1 glutamate-ammonia-ligase adenylyltransferase [Desulfuromonas sp. AOP6]